MRCPTPKFDVVAPVRAAFVHEGVRAGFEIVTIRRDGSGAYRLRGATTAVENGADWSVSYEIEVDDRWRTRSAKVTGLAGGDVVQRTVQVRDGHWFIDGVVRPDLDGCVDLDLESSVVTNTLPIHRLQFSDGAAHDVPAAFVHAVGLEVGRIDQTYRYTHSSSSGHVFAYASRSFDFSCELTYDESGLVRGYPGVARRYRI